MAGKGQTGSKAPKSSPKASGAKPGKAAGAKAKKPKSDGGGKDAKSSYGFQADVSKLLEIVAHSLYSDKEIFLRELISNASDACDKLRYAALTDANLMAGDAELAITLTGDSKAGTLTVVDNGIGMTHDELVHDLGTIARSGTAAFMEQMTGDDSSDVSLIGQFGVGFYSVFMVADRVKVTTVKAGATEGWVWQSDGKGSFTIEPANADTPRGTRIEIHLTKDQGEYADSARLAHIVKTYSDHIALPIMLTGEDDAAPEQLNAASALWTRAKSDIDDQQYTEFYHHVSHGGDEPWMTLHNKVEGVIEYASLIFIPSVRPYDLFHPERTSRLKLYVRRVFITDDCADLLPSWLRFLRGVIDSQDLPLNVSREMLQNNPVVTKIRAATVKRVLGELKKKAEKAPTEYAAFWDNFGPVMKEGLYEDREHQEDLIPLARFRSTGGQASVEGAGDDAGDESGWVGLADYVDRMADGQNEIFYITGDDPSVLATSPQLEAFRSRGIEVLLMTDPVDEFWINAVGEFDGKSFRSATRGDIDFAGLGAAKTGSDDASAPDEKTEERADDGDLAALVALLKLSLGELVKDVRASSRLTDSAVCLVADEGDMDLHMERLLRQHQRLDMASTRILELNPSHDLIRKMADTVREKGAEAGDLVGDYGYLLLDQARIIEGETIPDPVAFSRRMARVMAEGLAD